MLIGSLAAGSAYAQQRAATEAEARSYIFGAFLTHAAAAIVSEQIAIGPELQRRLDLPPGADRRKVYDALMALTDNKPLRVRKATAEEVTNYSAQASRELKQPLYTLEAGADIRLLIQYDLQANNIPFVGQLGVRAEIPQPRAAAVGKPAPPPPPPAVETPKPPVAAVEKPQPPVIPVVKPPVVEAEGPKPPRVIAVEPTPAPRPGPLRRTGDCVVKPVMSDQDLVNCGAAAR